MVKSVNGDGGFTGEAWSEIAETQQKGCMILVFELEEGDVATVIDGGD